MKIKLLFAVCNVIVVLKFLREKNSIFSTLSAQKTNTQYL